MMAAEPKTLSLDAALDATGGGPEHILNFIRILARSRVVVVTDKVWNGRSVPETSMRLMQVSDGDNTSQVMLAVFTDENHAGIFLQGLAGTSQPFNNKVTVDMAWALLGLPDKAGIMVNANSARGFRVSPEAAAQLKKAVELSHSFASIENKQRQQVSAGQALTQSTQWSEAEQTLSQLEDLVILGRIDAAKERLNQIPDTQENVRVVLAARSMLANARGERELAIKLLKDAIQKNDEPRLAGRFWSQLGKYYADAKMLPQAEDAYILACSSDPSEVRYAIGLARVLADQHRVKNVITLLEKTSENHPDDPEPFMQLGNFMMEFGQHAAALAAYDKVAGIDSENSSVHFNRAICLQTLGKLDESRTAFERALRLDPSLDGYSQYAQIRVFTKEDPELNAPFLQLLEQRARPDMPLSTQIDSNFALGKAYDSLGDLDTSFKYLETGNKLKRSAVTYSTSQTEREMDAIKTLFSKNLIERLQGKANLDLAPIFVVGMPRSGSTLTEQILAAHSHVNPGNELTHLAYMGQEFYEVWNRRVDARKFDEAGIVDDLRRLGATYKDRTAWLQIPGKRFTDKMPGNFMHIGLIYLLYPNATVIHCHRHPADTCLSCYERLFTQGVPFSYDQQELGDYYRLYMGMMQHWREVLPEGFVLDVQYERTVEDLENQVRRILDFCGFEFEPACLEFHKVERAVTTASLMQVRKPMYKSSVNRWMKYGDRLKPLLKALGPELVGPGAGT